MDRDVRNMLVAAIGGLAALLVATWIAWMVAMSAMMSGECCGLMFGR